MNLYLISQNRITGYGTYDSAIVVAKDVADAITIHPSPFVTHHDGKVWMGTYSKGGEYVNETGDWVPFEEIYLVEAEFLGKTKKPRGVILASFNAG